LALAPRGAAAVMELGVDARRLAMIRVFPAFSIPGSIYHSAIRRAIA